MFAMSWVVFPSKETEKKSWHPVLELRFTFTPPVLFSRKQGEFPTGKVQDLPTEVSVFSESWVKDPGRKRAEGVSLSAEERQLGCVSKEERVKLLRTENCKISDCFFLILPKPVTMLKVQTVYQRT